MNAKKTTNETNIVRGAGGFPALSILVAYVLTMAGMWSGSVLLAMVGLLGLLGSVVGMEWLVLGRSNQAVRHATSGSKVMHV